MTRSSAVLLVCLLLLSVSLLSGGYAHPALQPSELGLMELFEVSLEVPGEFANPYDPTEIEVIAEFTPPEGEAIQVMGFYMQPFTRSEDGYVPEGDPGWRVRFTPTQIGEWSYRIRSRMGEVFRTLQEGTFTVTPSQTRGFIRTSPNRRYFTFQSGEPYFPIGQNLGWSWEEGGGLDTYLEWLDRLQAVGANYARLFWDTAWFIGFDWQAPAGDYSDEQVAAWQMDTILEAARQRGIYLQVVLIWHQAFIQTSGPPVVIPSDPPRPNTLADFDSHAYNLLNGGPLRQPASLFQGGEVNSAVEDFLHRKIRYALARWGYSPNIFAWEILTEVDRLPNYPSEAHTEFINNLARFVRQNDPYGHLLTAGSRDPLPELLNNDAFDFAQVRVYQRRPIEAGGDEVAALLDALRNPVYQLDKPLLLTEFSLNPWFEPTEDDPNGVHVHNTLWASALSGLAGGGMSQWWDTYIDPQDLYHFDAPLGAFAQGVNWGTIHLEPIQVGIIPTRNDLPYTGLRLEDFNRNLRGSSLPDTLYQITPDGVFPSLGSMSSYLYGSGFNAEASRPITLLLNPPIGTILTIGIRDVAPNQSANLVITLDNQTYTALELTSGSANTAINIPLTAGEHRIVLDNVGVGWVELAYLEIAQYVAPARALALADRAAGTALVWIQNRNYTWQNAEADLDPMRFLLDIPHMPAGIYQVEYWDTLTGNVLGQEILTQPEPSGGSLTLTLPPLTKQLAVRVFQIAVAPGMQPTQTPIPTRTPLVLPSATPTYTPTATPSPTRTLTPSPTVTPSLTPSLTPTLTPTDTATPTLRPSETLVPPTATESPTTDTSIIPRYTRTPRPSGTPR